MAVLISSFYTPSKGVADMAAADEHEKLNLYVKRDF